MSPVRRDVWINGLSGRIALLSPDLSAWLRTGGTPDRAPDCPETMEQLSRDGLITDLTRSEEKRQFVRMVENIHANRLNGGMTYVFVPDYSCNLSCTYCFQKNMRSRHPSGAAMSLEMVRLFFEDLERFEKEELKVTVPRRQFLLYGGEPLLSRRADVVRRIVEGAQECGSIEIKAITNGTELEHFRDLLGPGKIASLQVSLDGPPPDHDRLRIFPDGAGSFKRIAKNIDRALDAGVSVNVRVNVDRNSVDRLPGLAAVVNDHGWAERKGFSIYAGALHSAIGEKGGKELLDRHSLFAEIERIQEECPEGVCFDQAEQGLEQNLLRALGGTGNISSLRQACYCGAHQGVIIFDGEGRLSTCLEQDRSQRFRIGAMDAQGRLQVDTQQLETWRSRTVANNRGCRQCPYALFCGGGCAVRAQDHHGTMYAGHCQGFQQLFDECVRRAYRAHVEKPAVTRM